MDQRGSLLQAIAQNRGVDKSQMKPEDMTEFKAAVARVLSPYASAILLDPEYSLPALPHVSKGTGVLLAYEKSGYDNTQPGRLPDLLPTRLGRRQLGSRPDDVQGLLPLAPSAGEGVRKKGDGDRINAAGRPAGAATAGADSTDDGK